MISSSKDDYMEASDGSRQVKIWLRCPSCRSDLTYTIRDTLLLRKVDEVLSLVELDKTGGNLTESQRSLHDALQRSKEVQTAVEESRTREANYLGLDELDEESEVSVSASPSIEEWGVEADLAFGVHESIRWPRSPVSSSDESSVITESQVDPILFGGLDCVLHDCDRISLTELMVSGNPDKLAEAAQTLAALATTLHSQKMAPSPSVAMSNPQVSRILKRSSVFDLVAEVKKAHQAEAVGPVVVALPRGMPRRSSSVVVKQMSLRQRRFPLPVRMPKYMEISRATWSQLSFVDHKWDGTVMDAYAKLTIGFGQRVTQRSPNHAGIENVLGGREARIELPNKPRILLCNVPRELGQQGATRGDVLTHVLGKNVSGMTFEQVCFFVMHALQGQECNIELVFNAERSVAEALKRRAMAMADEE
eukprot:Nitzschia sp. Nitz4//scaffold29_size155292//618//1880//NITZ4_002629-RA/size155292-processed-gene-0.0-mRNA-1//1//CDS//3329546361//5296//frame0